MNLAELPDGFAPIHLVRLDLPRIQCQGRFYNLDIAVGFLDFVRKISEGEGEYALLHDGGLIDDSTLPRPHDKQPLFTLLKKAA